MADRRQIQRGLDVVRIGGIAMSTGLAASALVTAIGTHTLLDVDGGEVHVADRAAPEAKGTKSAKVGSTTRSNSAKASAKKEAVEQITKRNPFCPTCVPADEQPEPETSTATPSVPGIAPGEVASELGLRLVATLEPVGEGRALATIYDRDLGVSGLFGTGEAVRAGVVVERIDHALVHLRNGSRLEYLEVGVEPKQDPRKKKSSSHKKPTHKRTNKRAIPGADEAIDCRGSDVCKVDRAFVDKVVSNPALLAKQARVVPSRRGGETRGYKLYGIRRGTLPKLLGFRNGDMITEINGQALTSIDAAMSLYAKLRRASHLEVAFVRRGKRKSKEIQII